MTSMIMTLAQAAKIDGEGKENRKRPMVLATASAGRISLFILLCDIQETSGILRIHRPEAVFPLLLPNPPPPPPIKKRKENSSDKPEMSGSFLL